MLVFCYQWKSIWHILLRLKGRGFKSMVELRQRLNPMSSLLTPQHEGVGLWGGGLQLTSPWSIGSTSTLSLTYWWHLFYLGSGDFFVPSSHAVWIKKLEKVYIIENKLDLWLKSWLSSSCEKFGCWVCWFSPGTPNSSHSPLNDCNVVSFRIFLVLAHEAGFTDLIFKLDTFFIK